MNSDQFPLPSSQQTNKKPLQRFLVLWLPRWSTDYHQWKAGTSVAKSPDNKVPLVLYEKIRGALRIAALTRVAEAAGLHIGQSMADARALCPVLDAKEMDREKDARGFDKLVLWHSQYSPFITAFETGDMGFDITGCAHLFGGEQAMVEHMYARLEAIGFEAQIGVSDTIGAAWAMAHFGLYESPVDLARSAAQKQYAPIIARGEQKETLSVFPIAALRISDLICDQLIEMGLKTIGQLYDTPRSPLRARFGDLLLLQLDRLIGKAAEPLVPLYPVPEQTVLRRFAEPISLQTDIDAALQSLVHSLCERLEATQSGAQEFVFSLFRVDHTVTDLIVHTSRSTRDPIHIMRVFSHRLEKLHEEDDAGFGYDLLRLSVPKTTVLDSYQLNVWDEGVSDQKLAELCDRMINRLGMGTVFQSRFRSSHLPERAVELVPFAGSLKDERQKESNISASRPVRLLRNPEEIVVIAEVPDGPPVRMTWRRIPYFLVKASGPERLGDEWWRTQKRKFTRDYYAAEDRDGRRYWIFRQGLYGRELDSPKWFLHGLFA